jgi:hypothetical protein
MEKGGTIMKRLMEVLFVFVPLLLACQISAKTVPTNTPLQPTISPTVIPIQNIATVLLANGFVRDARSESMCFQCQSYFNGDWKIFADIYSDSSLEIRAMVSSQLEKDFFPNQGETLAAVMDALYPNKLGKDVGNAIQKIEAHGSPIQGRSNSIMILGTEDNYDYLINLSPLSERILILVHPHTSLLTLP